MGLLAVDSRIPKRVRDLGRRWGALPGSAVQPAQIAGAVSAGKRRYKLNRMHLGNQEDIQRVETGNKRFGDIADIIEECQMPAPVLVPGFGHA